VPSTAEAERAITSGAGPVSFEARARGVAVDRTGLPTGVQRLLALAEAVPENQGARRAVERPGLLSSGLELRPRAPSTPVPSC
jgi:hypothetical protein